MNHKTTTRTPNERRRDMARTAAAVVVDARAWLRYLNMELRERQDCADADATRSGQSDPAYFTARANAFAESRRVISRLDSAIRYSRRSSKATRS